MPLSSDTEQWSRWSPVHFHPCKYVSSHHFSPLSQMPLPPALYLSCCFASAVATHFNPPFAPTSVTALIAGGNAQVFCSRSAWTKTKDLNTKTLNTAFQDQWVVWPHVLPMPIKSAVVFGGFSLALTSTFVSCCPNEPPSTRAWFGAVVRVEKVGSFKKVDL